jgi:DNA-binding MarR family transcriptional regulator
MKSDPERSNPTAGTSAHQLEIVEAVRRIIRSYDVHSRRLLTSGDVTLAQLLCLRALADAGPLTAKQLAEAIHISPSTMVGILDRLETKEFITRHRDPDDRRRVVVTISDAGQQLVLSCPPPLGEGLQREFSGMSARDQASLAAALRRVADLIDADSVPAPETD